MAPRQLQQARGIGLFVDAPWARVAQRERRDQVAHGRGSAPGMAACLRQRLQQARLVARVQVGVDVGTDGPGQAPPGAGEARVQCHRGFEGPHGFFGVEAVDQHHGLVEVAGGQRVACLDRVRVAIQASQQRCAAVCRCSSSGAPAHGTECQRGHATTAPELGRRGSCHGHVPSNDAPRPSGARSASARGRPGPGHPRQRPGSAARPNPPSSPFRRELDCSHPGRKTKARMAEQPADRKGQRQRLAPGGPPTLQSQGQQRRPQARRRPATRATGSRRSSQAMFRVNQISYMRALLVRPGP
jgi:hypothetical protein